MCNPPLDSVWRRRKDDAMTTGYLKVFLSADMGNLGVAARAGSKTGYHKGIISVSVENTRVSHGYHKGITRVSYKYHKGII